jgi:murein DD-endopeptidase MepM/ murein hydrolase activator NlpD
MKTDRPTLLKRLFMPLQGEIRNPYNEANGHYGVDIVAPENTMINAATAGFVILAEYSNENGWVIAIAGQQGITTFYKHNSRLLKKAGTYVRAGEPIAVIGNSGENSTGMHLHFEIWQEGRPLDPADYIQFN